MTFTELQLAPELIAALEKQQISEPTPIQSAALPVLLAGRDAYLHAETGTGKTLAYLLPIFSRLDTAQAATQAVVVAPTHELALQIHRQCGELAQNAGWPVRSLLLIGGTSTERQIEKLKKKPHLVVGSPGRIAAGMRVGAVGSRGSMPRHEAYIATHHLSRQHIYNILFKKYKLIFCVAAYRRFRRLRHERSARPEPGGRTAILAARRSAVS